MLFALISNTHLQTSQAAIKEAFTFQGKIVDDDGTNLTSGDASCVDSGGADTCDFRVSLYTAVSGGTLVWQETKSNVEVYDNAGIFNLFLDCSGTFSSCDQNGGPDFNSGDLFIQVEFDPDGDGDFAEGETFSPRRELSAVPYAFNANTLDGQTGDSYLRSDASDAYTSGTLSFNSSTELNTLSGSILDVDGDLEISDTSITLNGASTNLAATGDFSINTDDLFIEKSTGEVGIGTTNPGYLLDVNGVINVGSAGYIRLSDAAGGPFGFDIYQGTLGATTYSFSNSSGTQLRISGGNVDLRLQSAVVSGFSITDDVAGELLRITDTARVGIGDNSPDSSLEVLATTEQLRLTHTDDTYDAHFTVDGSGNLSVQTTADLRLLPNDDTDDYLYFNTTSNVPGLFWEGIAATDPGIYVTGTELGYRDETDSWVSFDSLANATSYWQLSSNVVNLTTATHDLAVGGSTLAASIFSIDEDTGTFLFGGDQSANPSLVFEATDSDTGTFGFNTNDAFYFTGANVAVGTTNPSVQLHIDQPGGSGINPTLRISQATNVAGIDIYEVNGDGNVYFDSLYNNSTDTNGVRFRIRSTGSPLTSLFMRNSGRVSIGNYTSNTASILNVYGNTAIGTGYVNTGAPTNGLLVEGNVGFGDTGPDTKLEVLATTEQLRLTHTDDTYDAHFTVDGSGNLSVQTTADLRLLPNDDTDDYLYFNTTSNVPGLFWEGIAATDPGIYVTGTELGYRDETDSWVSFDSLAGGTSYFQLSTNVVNPISATYDFAIGGTTLAASIFSIDEDTGTFLFGGDQSANPSLVFEATDSDTGTFGFNTNDAFYFSGANVGIGETNPGNKLHVIADSGVSDIAHFASFTGANDAVIKFSNGAGSTDILRLGSDAATGESWLNSFAGLHFGTGSATFESNERLTILSTGNVGIGAVSPDFPLEIEDSGTNTLGLNATGTGDPTLAFQLDGTTTFFLGVDDSDDDQFKIHAGSSFPGTTGDFVIDTNGHIGINAGPTDDRYIYAAPSLTTDQNNDGFRLTPTFNYTLGGNRTSTGMSVFPTNNLNENGFNADIIGYQTIIFNNDTYTADDVYGVWSEVWQRDATTGQIDNWYAFYALTDSESSTTVGNSYGLYVDLQNNGTINTTYGIRIADVIEGTQTNAYGIWGDEGDWVLDEDGNGTVGGTSNGGDFALGEDQDLVLYHNGTDSIIDNNTGLFSLISASNIVFQPDNDTDDYLYFDTTSNIPGLFWEGIAATDPGIYVSGTELGYRDETDSWVSFDSLAGGSSVFQLSTNVVNPTSAMYDFAIGGTTLAASIFSIDESDGIFLFGGDQSANPSLVFEATDSDTGTFGFNTNDAFYFTGANIGIGLTNPSADLHLFSASGNTVLTVEDDADDAGLYLDAGGTDEYAYIDFALGGTAYWELANDPTNSNAFYLYSYQKSGGADYIITAEVDGNVGIGMTDPAYDLDVAGDIRIGAGSRLWDADSGSYYIDPHATSHTNITRAAGRFEANTFRDLSGGTLTLQDDSGNVVIGGSGNTYTFNTASGPTYAGNARPSRSEELVPEYPGATLTGDGSNNTGTMTSDFCENGASGDLPQTNTGVCNTSGDVHNYYSWTTAQGSAQDYDIWIRWRIPDNFSAWASNPIDVFGKRTDATNNAVQVYVYDTTGTLENAGGTQVAGTSWTSTTVEASFAGTYTPGGYMTIRVVMTADTGGDSVQVGEINLDYLTNN